MSRFFGGREYGPAHTLAGECAVSILGGDQVPLCVVMGQHGKRRMGCFLNELARPHSAQRCVLFGPDPITIVF